MLHLKQSVVRRAKDVSEGRTTMKNTFLTDTAYGHGLGIIHGLAALNTFADVHGE